MSDKAIPAHWIEGEGPVVIFITGLGGFGRYWAAQVAALKDRFTCVTFDQPGIGDSPATPGPWSTAGWAQDVLALADHIGADRFAVVGHSTGGAIAQHVAAIAPERVAALVLSGTWLKADARFRRIFALRRQLLIEQGMAAYEEMGAILTRPLEWDTVASAGTAAMPKTSVDVILGRVDALVDHNGEDACRAIGCATLVAGACDDLLVPPNHARHLEALIANAELALVESGGHHFPQTRAGWFNPCLRSFLEAHA